VAGLTNAKRNYYIRLDNSLKGLLSTAAVTTAAANGQAVLRGVRQAVEQFAARIRDANK
jgi:hypothetical protein